jgi:hypothetical protein
MFDPIFRPYAYFGSSNVPTYLEHAWNVPGATGLPAAVVLLFVSPLIPFHLPVPCKNLQSLTSGPHCAGHQSVGPLQPYP